MMISSLRKRGRRTSAGLLVVGVLTVLSLLLAACGGSSGGGGGATTPKGPDLLTSGVLTVGSDTTYPPQEYIDNTTHQAAGFDIDLITAVAQQMGLKAKIVTISFDTIFDALSAKRFDIVMSAVSVTDERKKKFDFVPYFNAGESLLVQKGNPLNLKTVDDLCGKKVGVQNGTIEQDDLNAASKKCTSAGKPAIQMTVLTDQTEVINLLANKRVVATYQDSPVTDYYIKLNPGRFDVGGSVVNAGLEGIVIRKGDTSMFNAVQTAFNKVKSDGTYHQLILKWGLTNEEITMVDRRVIAA
jgi:polar amino acid transport system substrate-binding protein